jgi:hypothetical protein
MKTIFKQLAAMMVLGVLAVSPVLAQNAAPLEARTNTATSQKPGLDKDLEKTRIDNEKDLEKTRLDNQKDIEKTRLDNEMQMANSRSDNRRSMVHDLSWNSWVVFAIVFGIAGLYVSNERDKRRQETIRLMIEKGAPITPEVLDGLRKRSRLGARSYDLRGYLSWGITEVLVGIAIICLVDSRGGRIAGWIVLAVGAANLILWFIDRAHSNGGQSK